MSAYHDAPRCPVCRVPAGSSRAAISSGYRGKLMCCACGVVWDGTREERAQAKRADRAWEERLTLEQRRAEVRKLLAADRQRARDLFLAAAKPLPEWLR